MTRRFIVETPDQLLALQAFATDGNLTRAASIWKTTRDKKGEKGTSWDRSIFVDFCAWDRKRTAIVFRAMTIICPPTMGKSEKNGSTICDGRMPYTFAHPHETPRPPPRPAAAEADCPGCPPNGNPCRARLSCPAAASAHRGKKAVAPFDSPAPWGRRREL